MNAKHTKHQYHLQTWTPIIHECKNSGMSVKAWCEENDVNEKQFYYWQRRVREELLPTIKQEINPSTTFMQVPRIESASTDSFNPDMVVSYGNLRIELMNSVLPELLAEVIKAVRYV